MLFKTYQVDAFTDELFGGNPAAVCPLPRWLSAELMQKIAAENNLSETAFIVAEQNGYAIRWFTPKTEVELCGHATLGAAYIILTQLDKTQERISFSSNSGILRVVREGDYLVLDFPAVTAAQCSASADLIQTLGCTPDEVWKGADYMAVLQNERAVREFKPDLLRIEKLAARGLIITAAGDQADFVSRWFGPQVGVNEDPVTGSAHCMLAPYWASRLDKTKLYAEQLSSRLGKIHCEVQGDRVLLKGQAVLYAKGEIQIPDALLN